MALASGICLLNGRYKLTGAPIALSSEGELWKATDEHEFVPPYLLKAWSFYEERPDDVQRALWDAELRTLYRVRSTPGSEDSLIQLQDLGIDSANRCFVMVFKTQGVRVLSSLLGGERSEHAWLSGAAAARRELWQMLGQLAEGLALLHDQQVVHRCVGPESVFLDPDAGPESCRLGGFEWSVRLGRPAAAHAFRQSWETPPEALEGSVAFGPDADWYAFGMLTARCMLSIEHLDNERTAPLQRYGLVFDHLAKSKTKNRLIDLERDLISKLIARDPSDRLTHRSQIRSAIDEIVRTLQQPEAEGDRGAKHIVVINPRNPEFVAACMDNGLDELLKLEPGDVFDPRRPEHTSKLRSFLYADFVDGATIAPMVAGRNRFILSGNRMHLRIQPFERSDEQKATWQNAFCSGALDYMTAGAEELKAIPPERLMFFSTLDRRTHGEQLDTSLRWEPVLPQVDKARERREEQERFCEFLRITNQIDILIRDAELFRCRVEAVDIDDETGTCTEIHVSEVPRLQEPNQTFRQQGGMAEFLLLEKSSGKEESSTIVLCAPEHETLTAAIGNLPTWRVKEVDVIRRRATLVPKHEMTDPPEIGDIKVLRTKGLSGQVSLIRRRKDAIGRLERHTYLLESLSSPGQVFMDSGQLQLPVPLDARTVDPSKLRQITKILAVRPVYALQGPPGTGKTHMVAWLLREILEEDPVAQILITAQAHPAVDVLRAKVEQEAFKDVPEDRRPLAIRLRKASASRGEEIAPEKGSEQEVTKELLQATVRRLDKKVERQPLSAVQKEWREACLLMVKELDGAEADLSKEFRELVKRSASITYSTTGDGDLAALADEVSYDWSIVEEAAKAHGFELALPLYLGHRWLLIGDDKQLPPYRIDDYVKAVADLDMTVAALESLRGVGSLLDSDFLRQWRQRPETERSAFGDYCKAWLKLFGQLHRLCGYHEPDEGLLTGQHRMHPDIGELVSEVYYKGKLEHHTRVDESPGSPPSPGILHGLSTPPELRERAVVWLDTPWARDDHRTLEQSQPRYRNPAEAHALERFLLSLRPDGDRPLDLAVLSPYAQQVGYLRELWGGGSGLLSRLEQNGLSPAPDPRRSSDQSRGGRRRERDGVFTVDSFQGNQAKIVAVSLVRNNTREPGRGIGFLDEAPRMNVLMSRAERLLILVGSWDFFWEQVRHVPVEIEDEPLRHLAMVMRRLNAWFDEGRAARIPADLSDFRSSNSRSAVTL